MSRCKMHCPSSGRSPWLRDLLLALTGLAVFYWLAGRAAVAVDAAATSLLVPASCAVGAGVLVLAAKVAVTAVLNRRALAAYARIEREAWAPVASEPAALPVAARALEPAPAVRVESWVVREPVEQQWRDAA